MPFKFPHSSQFLQPLDLVLRGRTLFKRLQIPWAVWILGASFLEAGSAFAPWLSWVLWPFLVWGLVQGRQQFHVLSWVDLPAAFGRQWRALVRRPGTLYTLFLYGVLNFLIFTGLSEGSHLLPSVAVLFPGAEGSLFPYTFSQATSFLISAACAERLCSTQDDVLKVLAYSVRDLLTSPISWLLLALAYAFPVTDLATHLGTQLAYPAAATWVGHGLLSLVVLLWALGADHATVTNHS